MNASGAARWKELLEGRRHWSAAGTSREDLLRFTSEVVDPLRAMEVAGMIQLKLTGGFHDGMRLEHEAHVIEVADWVHDLARRSTRVVARSSSPILF